jgi:hypothetical protein
MTKRIDHDQAAPNGVEAYGYVMQSGLPPFDKEHVRRAASSQGVSL